MIRVGLLALLLILPACATAAVGADNPAVTAAELRAHVEWLADDAREGRRAGTAAERIAAAYVAQQFARAGLQPAGEAGGWYQEFDVPLPAQPGACSLTVEGRPVAGVGTLACSATGTVRAPLASGEVRGAIALLRAGTNDAGALRSAIRAAADQGAVGAVVGIHANDVAAGAPDTPAFDFARGELALPLVTVASADFTILWTRTGAGERPDAALGAAVQRSTARSRNVLGLLPGSGPDVLVVGAHFDHLGWGGEDSLAPGERAIHNGADDNASGTAVLIELAEEWGGSEVGVQPPEVGVLFAAWSAEELGLLGSAHWVKNPTVDLACVRANVNLDMVGRAAGGRITVGSAETASAFRPALDAVQASLREGGIGLELAVAEGQLPGGGGSDHMSFQQAGIPALFFFSGLHADYHKPSDDAEKLDYALMREVAVAVSELLVQLQDAEPAALAFLKPAEPAGGEREARRPGVWFGSIPDYAAAPEGGGMQIAGTSPGSPAEKAGLQAGDVIRKLGDVAIGDIYDFMDALGQFKTGDTVAVEFVRGGAIRIVPLTFIPRPGA